MNSSKLVGGQFRTQPSELAGEFREIQFRFAQSSLDQDMEPHFFEFHYTVGPVSYEAPS